MTTVRRHQNLLAGSIITSTANLNARTRKAARGFQSAESHVAVMPCVVPWPHATDTNGATYQHDLYGVYSGFTYTNSEATFNASLVPVPQELPSGYTHRWKRDHNISTADNSKTPNRIGQSSPFAMVAGTGRSSTEVFFPFDWAPLSYVAPRIRTAQALTSYNFGPENRGTSCGSTFSASGPGGHVLFTTQGLDYFRWVLTTAFAATYSKFRVTVGYFTDGSASSDHVGFLGSGRTYYTAYPDNILFQEEKVSGVAYDSGFLYNGDGTHDFTVPVGERAYLQMVFEGFNIADAAWVLETNYTTFTRPHSLQWRRRTDIPLPWTCTGENGLIAPGGVVPGIIPGYP